MASVPVKLVPASFEDIVATLCENEEIAAHERSMQTNFDPEIGEVCRVKNCPVCWIIDRYPWGRVRKVFEELTLSGKL